MSATKRLFAAAGVIIAVIIAAVAFSSTASAAPYVNNNTLGVSDQTPCAGCSVQVAGGGFTPGETIDLSEHSTPFNLGTTTAGADGSFAATVTLSPNLVGQHTIVAVGETSGHSASVSVDIAGSGAGGQETGGNGNGSGGSGGLAATGVAVIGIGSLGVVLLAGGGLMLLAGRRRQKVNA